MQKKKLNTIWQTHLFFLLIAFRLESWFAFVDFEEKMMVIEVTFVLCQNGLIGNFDAWYLFVICNLADLLSICNDSTDIQWVEDQKGWWNHFIVGTLKKRSKSRMMVFTMLPQPFWNRIKILIKYSVISLSVCIR